MSRYGIFIALFSIALIRPAFSQSPAQIYSEGVEALYSLEFPTAEARFRQLTTMVPQDPANWNYLASAMWLKIVAAQEKLSMESFSGASLGTERSEDTVSAEAEKQLRDTLATAISKADAQIKANRKDVKAIYAKGVSKGTLAAFEAVAKQNYFRALGNAREARDLHEDVLKQDPSFTDAKLTLGLYEYAIGTIPGWLRAVLFIWSGGNKARGIANVNEVAKAGSAASTDAKMLLIVMYNRERQYENSLNLLSQLHTRFPRNYLLELSTAAVHSRMKQFDKSLATYQSVLKKIQEHRDGYDRLEAGKVELLIARAYLEKNDLPQARAVWQRIIDDKDEKRTSDTDRANAHLWLGKFLDAEGQRARALEHYNVIVTLKVPPRLKEEAEKYRKQPFKF